MKLVAAWILGILVAGAGAYAYDHYTPSLPYTEPHHTFELPDGTQCAAWQFSNGSVVAICEDHTPVLRVPERKCGLNL